MKRSLRILILACIVTSIGVSLASGKGNPTKSSRGSNQLLKTMTNDVYAPILINNVFSYYGNNGDGALNIHRGDNEGFEFPQGNGKTLVFEEGIIWGGKQNGTYKVGGSTYWHGLQAGSIITPGISPIADNPAVPKNRIYRVRRNVNPSTPFDSAMQTLLTSSEALLTLYEGFTAQQIYNQYITDWNNWPAASGAPYIDVNNNGVYDPSVDIPGFPGADQTLWYVANDLDTSRVYLFSGSMPLGLEIQRTIWAYNQYGALGNTVFTRTRFMNKSGYSIDSMYVGQWADPDLGGAGDDLAGCDSLRNLAYAYNGTNNDLEYGSAPPAIGYVLLYGPTISSVLTDTAYSGGIHRGGEKNLGMTSFVPFINGGGGNYADPTHNSPLAATQWLNVLHGYSGAGVPFVNPTTGLVTKYVFSGDPIGGSGWFGSSPSDVRITSVAGPFSMAVGDTQEVIVASVAGQGADRLSSIVQMKSNSDQARLLANTYFSGPTVGLSAMSSLYSTGTTVALHGSLFNPDARAVTTQWVLTLKPGASSAAINVLGAANATIVPDVAGTYKIRYQVLQGTSVVDFVDAQFDVTTVQKPVPNLAIHTHGTIGDTVYIDGSLSSDPQALPLTYKWTVSGGDVFDHVTSYDSLLTTIVHPTASQTMFIARRASTYFITLSVSDSVWTTTQQLEEDIAPLRSGSQSISSVTSSSLFPQGGYYGYGPFRTDSAGTLWTSMNGELFPLNFADLTHPAQVYPANLFGDYTLRGGAVYGALGTSGVSIQSLDGNGHITGIATINPPGVSHPRSVDTTVSAVYVTGHYLLFSSGVLGLYVYDISNPLAPVFLTNTFNGQYWGNFQVDGTVIIGVNPRNSVMSVLDITNPASPSYVASSQLQSPFTSVRKYGSLFYFFKSDTIGIYEMNPANSFVPVLRSTIPVERTLGFPNIIYDIACDGGTLMVATAQGMYFYDVTNANVPVLSGMFVTGTRYTRAYLGGGYALALNGGRTIGYEGLNFFSGVTSVALESFVGLPTQYQLRQNYPNPFNPMTNISFSLPKQSKVRLTIIDLLGREVATLVNNEQRSAGNYTVPWNAASFASGVYFYRLQAGEFAQTKKLVLMK